MFSQFLGREEFRLIEDLLYTTLKYDLTSEQSQTSLGATIDIIPLLFILLFKSNFWIKLHSAFEHIRTHTREERSYGFEIIETIKSFFKKESSDVWYFLNVCWISIVQIIAQIEQNDEYTQFNMFWIGCNDVDYRVEGDEVKPSEFQNKCIKYFTHRILFRIFQRIIPPWNTIEKTEFEQELLILFTQDNIDYSYGHPQLIQDTHRMNFKEIRGLLSRNLCASVNSKLLETEDYISNDSVDLLSLEIIKEGIQTFDFTSQIEEEFYLKEGKFIVSEYSETTKNVKLFYKEYLPPKVDLNLDGGLSFEGHQDNREQDIYDPLKESFATLCREQFDKLQKKVAELQEYEQKCNKILQMIGDENEIRFQIHEISRGERVGLRSKPFVPTNKIDEQIGRPSLVQLITKHADEDNQLIENNEILSEIFGVY